MTVSLRKGRPGRPRPVRGSAPASSSTSAGGTPPPSVREVCLIGVGRDWSEGDRVTWSGRSYRVASTRPRVGPPGAGGPVASYAYLDPATAQAAVGGAA